MQAEAHGDELQDRVDSGSLGSTHPGVRSSLCHPDYRFRSICCARLQDVVLREFSRAEMSNLERAGNKNQAVMCPLAYKPLVHIAEGHQGLCRTSSSDNISNTGHVLFEFLFSPGGTNLTR